ncbi:MAG TPA: Uma2 family endonuclease [Burkholderiaceae bacterium]|nr:Uma2 family endonuclease [Burkholderiaceae bacterium]
MNAPIEPTRLKLTITQYRQMGERGILPPGERVELIDGEIIRMAPIGPPHAGILNRLLNDRLASLCKGKAVISAQHPVEVDDYNEPQPDLCLLRWRDNYYIDRHPAPADVLLLIEISDSSLRYDRSVKRALYARAGLPRYWIVDVNDRSVIVFSEPSPDGYRNEQRHREGERLPLGGPDSPLAGLALDVSGIVGHLPPG